MVICNDIQLTPLNGRTVRLTGDLSKCKVEKIHGVIVSMEFSINDCSWEVKLGETIRTRRASYRVNVILPIVSAGNIICYDLAVAKLTDSSIFVLPLLGVGTRKLFMWDSLLVNVFIETPDEKDCIALLYRFSGEPIFTKFESALCSFRNFRTRIDPDPYHVLFVFDVQPDARIAYECFTKGQYSKIPDEWKLKILEYHDFDIDGHTGKILFKAESLKTKLEEELDVTLPPDAELRSKPNLSLEVFDPAYYAPSKPKL
jgi:hypothetical protein